ncbi:unnamed protein product [Vitrella brassicaformis CCMP3155]|uniref:Uncharacterized protein n=1 Tax=Vitrella brassicaformis (strain CCMP3155) TaxID=1169540 RepID=A0A0G4F9K4_VITBC|nr:unnamed protein product [Vitrella brassicaformis CCMP3155]|eukprot:CEM08938.1 unnamed protein product [Vitrella brassicaformis CCMP3155]
MGPILGTTLLPRTAVKFEDWKKAWRVYYRVRTGCTMELITAIHAVSGHYKKGSSQMGLLCNGELRQLRSMSSSSGVIDIIVKEYRCIAARVARFESSHDPTLPASWPSPPPPSQSKDLRPITTAPPAVPNILRQTSTNIRRGQPTAPSTLPPPPSPAPLTVARRLPVTPSGGGLVSLGGPTAAAAAAAGVPNPVASQQQQMKRLQANINDMRQLTRQLHQQLADKTKEADEHQRQATKLRGVIDKAEKAVPTPPSPPSPHHRPHQVGGLHPAAAPRLDSPRMAAGFLLNGGGLRRESFTRAIGVVEVVRKRRLAEGKPMPSNAARRISPSTPIGQPPAAAVGQLSVELVNAMTEGLLAERAARREALLRRPAFTGPDAPGTSQSERGPGRERDGRAQRATGPATC